MPAAIVDAASGNVSSASNQTSDQALRANILIELRVISAILLAQMQNVSLVETVEQLRQDQVTAIPNPPI